MDIEDAFSEYELNNKLFWGNSEDYGPLTYIDELFEFLDEAEGASTPSSSQNAQNFKAEIYKLDFKESDQVKTYIGKGSEISVAVAGGSADATMDFDGDEMLFPLNYYEVTITMEKALPIKERNTFTISSSSIVAAIGVITEIL